MTETILALAERHVAEGEERLARQQRFIQKLEEEGSQALAIEAKQLLTTMEETLTLMRDHLRIEREY